MLNGVVCILELSHHECACAQSIDQDQTIYILSAGRKYMIDLCQLDSSEHAHGFHIVIVVHAAVSFLGPQFGVPVSL